jgi:hypothetical protein
MKNHNCRRLARYDKKRRFNLKYYLFPPGLPSGWTDTDGGRPNYHLANGVCCSINGLDSQGCPTYILNRKSVAHVYKNAFNGNYHGTIRNKDGNGWEHSPRLDSMEDARSWVDTRLSEYGFLAKRRSYRYMIVIEIILHPANWKWTPSLRFGKPEFPSYRYEIVIGWLGLWVSIE